ncbi:hypothetical protein JHK84_032229 [Glycine max]|nr:hypothetical protein JHK85_032665 [Glycine max]KAG5146686.1 hypothetical protein JHK84_032229 [Glycine max]
MTIIAPGLIGSALLDQSSQQKRDNNLTRDVSIASATTRAGGHRLEVHIYELDTQLTCKFSSVHAIKKKRRVKVIVEKVEPTIILGPQDPQSMKRTGT